ncbi:MAG: helix-turn-helix domain-containing protein, partial [Desulfuromonadales bacterium]
ELAILEFTGQINKLMQEKQISKVELARLLGTSPAYVTKIFRGDANFTMRSMVKLARVLGGRFTPGVIATEPSATVKSNLIPFPTVVYKTAVDEKMIANYGR